MPKMPEDIAAKFDTHERALLSLSNTLKAQAAKYGDLNETIKIVKKDNDSTLSGVKELIKMGGNKNSSEGMTPTNKEELSLLIRSILLEDKELLETFTKVIENITTFNQNKKAVDEYIDNKNGKKKSRKISLLTLLVLSIVAISTVLYFMFDTSKSTVAIAPGEVFFEVGKKIGQSIDVSADFDITNEDEEKYYFMINGKEYYTLKKK